MSRASVGRFNGNDDQSQTAVASRGGDSRADFIVMFKMPGVIFTPGEGGFFARWQVDERSTNGGDQNQQCPCQTTHRAKQ